MSLEPGQTLSHYRLLSKIGEGGMGEVYLAEDTTLKRKVALKVLPASMADDPARLERFQREAEAIAALNHPNIVTIYSVEQHEATRFLTMELVEGESLDRKVAPGGLPLAEVFDIGVAIADALAAAHEKGIVHRDLKPANVMLTREGRVKVLDFGLAKLATGREPTHQTGAATEAATKHASLTGEGMIVGTVPYMSPEQLSGKAVDHRTDIFSLGVMLYELSVGRRPFTGETSAIITSSILRDTPRPVSEIREDVPRHLGRIIAHCLEKEPRDRVQTSRDVYNELRGLRKEVESGTSGQSQVMSATSMPAAASAPTPVSTPSGVAAAAGGSRLWLGVAAGAAVVIVVVAAFWLGTREKSGPGQTGPTVADSTAGERPSAPAAPTETNSLAVLPFTNMSSDKEQEYFSDGLTEELLNALVKIPDLKVAGRTSSFSFKGKNEDLRVIGEKLGVANILEGSVRKSGDTVRITAQLVKASDGFHLWSETYDRTLKDIFAVQGDIAHAVAQALRVTLLGRGTDAKSPDAESYDLILRARYVMQNRTEDSIRRAREILEQALERSPDDAPAWAEMALLHRREGELATTVEARQEALRQAREALTKALELDPELAVAHSRMAGVHRDSWEFEAAERSTERALAADPRNPIVMANAANLYSMLGRSDDAISLRERTLEMDPLNVFEYTDLASSYVAAGRLDKAEALCREALELQPDSGAAYSIRGQVHLLRGEAEEARADFAKFTEVSGLGEYGRLSFEALVQHTAGDDPASRKATEEFEKQFGEEDPSSCAELRAWRGETDAAFAWLDKALAARDPWLAQIKLDSLMQSLHTDPRWNALLKKIGLPTD